ncbi:atpase p, partial [Lasius niger]
MGGLPAQQAKRQAGSGATYGGRKPMTPPVAVDPAVVMDASLTLALDGMHCAACAVSIERVLNRLSGVEAHVNFASASAQISYASAAANADSLIARVRAIGFDASVQSALNEDALDAREAQQTRRWRRQALRCALAALLSLPLLAQML